MCACTYSHKFVCHVVCSVLCGGERRGNIAKQCKESNVWCILLVPVARDVNRCAGNVICVLGSVAVCMVSVYGELLRYAGGNDV